MKIGKIVNIAKKAGKLVNNHNRLSTAKKIVEVSKITSEIAKSTKK